VCGVWATMSEPMHLVEVVSGSVELVKLFIT
jgi:hypothetical protein